MTIEELLDQFDDLLDDAFTLPFSSKKVVDAAKARDIIDDLRLSIPQEVRQAKAIVSDRNDIIESARKEAESIIREAENKAKNMVAREEIVRSANAKSTEIINEAHMKAREIKKAATDYADDTLKKSDQILQQVIAAQREISKNIEENFNKCISDNREVCKKTEELIGQNVTQIRQTRKGIRNPQSEQQG